MQTENLKELRELRAQEKAIKASIETVKPLAIEEAKALAPAGGKFPVEGVGEFVLDINPADYTGSDMDKWFDMFRLLESYFTVLPHWQTFTAEDYLRWFDMPFDEFKTMWSKFPKPDPTFDKNEWDMTHHCEI